MSVPIPPSRPRASLTAVMAAAQKAWPPSRGALPSLFVLAVRAYYRDTMGVPRENDFSMFDDAIFIVTPFGFSAWNANTDPSRAGWNPGVRKFMARLQPGVWNFRRLKHHARRPTGYMAFGQGADPVTVERIDSSRKIRQTETGIFGINLHRASTSGTSSEGCLTVPVGQWVSFRSMLDDAIAKTDSKTFPLILIDGPIVLT
jgi:lysozyme